MLHGATGGKWIFFVNQKTMDRKRIFFNHKFTNLYFPKNLFPTHQFNYALYLIFSLLAFFISNSKYNNEVYHKTVTIVVTPTNFNK